ncbi:hypothetical protein E2C01_084769 [Portunus trituberculatus]|uniref:Uncharacterized protein n=1 Tax=Portunus trituberculatus TaxID=210409 RepID=A0A5B7J520_PORTR|nr:hypothetical protein [Portunus trituberculatus]
MGGTCSREAPTSVGPRVGPIPHRLLPPCEAWPGQPLKFACPAEGGPEASGAEVPILNGPSSCPGPGPDTRPGPRPAPHPHPLPDANHNWKHTELEAWRDAGEGEGAPPPRRAASAQGGPGQLEPAGGWRLGQRGPRLGSSLRWGPGGLGDGLAALCWHYHPHYLR